jgi:lantibiotic modifying enzyme
LFEATLIRTLVNECNQTQVKEFIMNNQDPDKRQKQSKKRKYKQWLKWLCKPETLRLLFQIGPVIFRMLKWLIDFLQN